MPGRRFTGWDADGGYAEYAVVAGGVRLPPAGALGDVEAAPLLCAGIIGYRALRGRSCRRVGGSGIYGFGASAHVVAQVALAQGATVHVLTRSAEARALALELGAASAGAADAAPPEPLDSAILFAPAGELVPGRDAGARPGRHARRRRHPPHRRPRPEVRRGAVPGEAAAQRHRQHACRRRGVPPPRRHAGHSPHVDPRPLAEADLALADLAADKITGAAVLMA